MRRIRITVLALALTALFTATALAAGTQAVGDVNGSGNADMTDMQCLYELLSTGQYSGSLSDEAGRRAADINGDGRVDILDYQRLYDILRQKVDYDHPVYEYDENGREIKKSYYDATGRVNRYLVYEYGADGRKSAAVCYNADGSARYNCKIAYRADDWAEWTYCDPETNKVLGVDLDDANGVLRQSTEYDSATEKIICVWEYDETGTLRKYTKYNTNTGEAAFALEYDEQGRITGYREYSGGEVSFRWTAVYDANGIETRTYYDATTGNVTGIEVRDANGTLRKFSEYNADTGEVAFVWEYDEQGRTIDYKEYGDGTLSFHWSAVYDENGAEIRTYYDTVTGEKANIEKREYDAENKTCTITQYDVRTNIKYRVQIWDMNGEDDWTLIKETCYDENGNITSEQRY